jgi:hypothetical protein
MALLLQPSRELWLKAQQDVGTCMRCVDWDRMGLSATCPSCDASILKRYDELRTDAQTKETV